MRSTGAIEVAQRNIISRTEKKALDHEDVQQAALRADGQEMATISVFNTKSVLGIRGELQSNNLRFWKRSSDGRLWHLLTEVKRPHRGQIMCLRMCALHSLALTCGKDGTFKIWTAFETQLAPTPKALLKRQNVPVNADSKVMWKCSGVGTFGSAQEFVSGDISSDGSCLAIATRQTISLWEVVPNLKRRRIINLDFDHFAKSVRFLPRRPLLLLMRTKSYVVLIDLDRTVNVDPKVMWTFPAITTLDPVEKEESTKEQESSPLNSEEKQSQKKKDPTIIDIAIHPQLPIVLIASKKDKKSTSTQLDVMGPEGSLRQTIELEQDIVEKSLSFVELPEDGTLAQVGRLSAVFTSRSREKGRPSKKGRGILYIIKDVLAGATPIVAEGAASKAEPTGVNKSLKELKKKKKKKKKRKLDVHGEKSKKTKRL